MNIFLGIGVIVTVVAIMICTIRASHRPVNGEEKTLHKLDQRIHKVGLVLHSYIPKV